MPTTDGVLGMLSDAPHDFPSVLVVEDDPVSALVVRKVLEDAGYAVQIAEDGHQALEIVKDGDTRVIVSDWMMPRMDGVELCRRIRDLELPYTYFILLTAKAQREDRNVAFESGADDMLSKPLDRDELLSRLKVARRIIRTEQELHGTSARLRVANTNLEIASRRFEELFQRLPVACFTVASDGMIHEWNREAETSFCIEAPFAFMRTVDDVFGVSSAGFWNEKALEELFKGNGFEGSEWSLSLSDGSIRHFVGSAYPFTGPSGEFIGVISANVDITDRVQAEKKIEDQMIELAEMNRRLELLSTTDGLTGLRNHRYFQEALESSITDLSPTGRPVSLVLLDVDHFKGFNDSFGHVAGDAVLKRVASVLRDHVSEPGLPARYGGEEFAVVLPGHDLEEAVQIAEALRQAIQCQSWEDRSITASFGVATTHAPIRNKELISMADEALYRSKADGRNRVTFVDRSGSLLSAA